MMKKRLTIFFYLFCGISLGFSQILCPPSEVYRPDSFHTYMSGVLRSPSNIPVVGLRLPFLQGDSITNVQRVNNVLVYAGDIELGLYDSVISPTSIYRNPDSDFLWNCNVISYEIAMEFAQTERIRIQAAIKYINRMTHIFWKPKQIGDNCFVLFKKEGGSYSSPIGCSCKTNNQSHVIELDEDPVFGKIVHEMTHTMGLYHEQQRVDRDNYVTIHTTHIRPAYQGNFKKQDSLPTYIAALDGTIYGDYDCNSIMHYNQYAFSMMPPVDIPNFDPWETITPLSGANIGQRRGYSPADIAKINALYPIGIEKIGTNQYTIVYLINGVVVTTFAQCSLVDANFNLVQSLPNQATNSLFTVNPAPLCAATMLQVSIGGCTYYKDLF